MRLLQFGFLLVLFSGLSTILFYINGFSSPGSRTMISTPCKPCIPALSNVWSAPGLSLCDLTSVNRIFSLGCLMSNKDRTKRGKWSSCFEYMDTDSLAGIQATESAMSFGLSLNAFADLVVSLGINDTVFGILEEPPSCSEGHVFPHPIDTKGYMIMMVYKNRSLTREDIHNCFAESSWEVFNKYLVQTSPLNVQIHKNMEMEKLQELHSVLCSSSSSFASNLHPVDVGAEEWERAERRVDGILSVIQPTVMSERRRKEIIEYI